jgi:DNA polymerase III subunit epsilon
MSARARFLLGLVALAVLIFGSVTLSAWLLWAIAGDEARHALLAGIQGHVAPVVAALVLAYVVAAALLRSLLHSYFQRARAIGEQIGTMNEANPEARLAEDVPEEFRAIVRAANTLADCRDALLKGVAQRVGTARQSLETERNRLAALMGELTQSVVVCNQDGRILLYNALARQQFRALSHAPEVAGGGELIGLGRSIHGVLERSAVQHGLEIIERQRRRGVAQPVANFISARGGSLLRVRMSPVPLAGGQGAGGFILLFDDITDDIRRDRRRDRLMQTLTDEQRAALALIATAVGGLEQGVADEAERLRLLTQVREGVNGIARRIDAAASEFAETVRGRWPMEDIHIDDLMEAARTRLQGRTGVPVRLAGSGQGWLRVDSFALLQALEFLASRIVEAFGLRELQLRSSQDGGELWLDLVWSGHAASTETLMSWELDAIEVDGHDTPLTVRDVLDRNAAEMSVQRDRVGQQSFLRFALPACASLEAPCGMPAMPDSRPEFYDFDLFTWSGPAQGFDDQPLVALSYTAFDTETTGLDPSGGDEIIQIGATRIVNGKLLRGESFEQLIDPKRALGAESIAIHGIQPEMLVGQPDITTVLPAFRAFAADTVLVAHNAAFDMRFLQIKEATTGVVFDLPVLDTLLLSALLHPSQESHRLEAIAERLGVNVVGRHTALGDALVTAEVFIRMLPLLAERGIRTLGQARAASEQTYYARLKY